MHSQLFSRCRCVGCFKTPAIDLATDTCSCAGTGYIGSARTGTQSVMTIGTLRIIAEAMRSENCKPAGQSCWMIGGLTISHACRETCLFRTRRSPDPGQVLLGLKSQASLGVGVMYRVDAGH